MGWFLPLLCLSLSISNTLAYPPAHAAFFRRQTTEGPHITISNGELMGRVVTVPGDQIIHAFEGIPYAERPERLQNPVKKKNWEGVLDATKTPPRCLQSIGRSTEDCLFLSVIAPKKTSQQYPVIVIVSGLDFSTGGVVETDVHHVAQYLAVKGLVVVSIQYRTGPTGFCTTGDSVIPGNYGLFDVKMAFEWVRDNIADFGGNPIAITAYGSSAGAALIDSLLLNKETNVIIFNVIYASGMGRHLFKHNITESCKAFMKSQGLDTSTKENMKQAILAEPVDSSKLASGELKVTEDVINKFSLDWAPVWDNDFFKGNLEELRRLARHKAMIIGTTDLEGAGFTDNFSNQQDKTSWENKLSLLLDTIIPEDKREKEKPRLLKEYTEYAAIQLHGLTGVNVSFEHDRVAFQKAFGEAIMASTIYDEIEHYREKHGEDHFHPIYLYDFKFHDEFLTGYEGLRGAKHGMDQWYAINMRGDVDTTRKQKNGFKMINLYTHIMFNFAKYSDPNGKKGVETELLDKWEPINSEHKTRNYQIQPKSKMIEHYYNGRPEQIRNWAIEIAEQRKDALNIRIYNGEIEGYVVENVGATGVRAFEGIPFAEKAQRLQYPVKKKNWTGVLETKTTPKRCLQSKRGDAETWEDCLFLSVIAPMRTNEKLPVIVVIHGGAFSTGGVEETKVPYVAKHLVSKGVIVVPIQYRTGPLGFCTTKDDVIPGNYGMFDVKMALEWVRDNIAYFGGNPDQVTAYGGSAGAALIDALQLNPETTKLFHKMIIWSGAGRDLFKYDIKSSCKKFMEKMEIDTSTSLKMREAMIAEKNLTKLKSGWHEVTEDAIENFTLDWSPVFDGKFFKGDLKELRKNAPKKPMIIGMADLEGAGFTSKFQNQTNANEWRAKLQQVIHKILPSDRIKELEIPYRDEYDDYANNQARLANETVRSEISFQKAFGELLMASVVYDEIDYYQKKHGNDESVPIYLYDFKYHNRTITGPSRVMGAFHSMDQWYGIGSLIFSPNFENYPGDKVIQKMYTDMMVNFAKTSDPNGSGATALPVKWERITNEHRNRNYKIDLEPSMTEDYYNGRPERIRNFSRQKGFTEDL